MKKEKKVKHKKKAIIFIVCFAVLILGVSAYFIFEHSPRRDFRGGNFQPLNQTTQDKITSFFESSPSYSDIENYCKENPVYCMYYCREMNTQESVCSEIMNFTIPRGNFTGYEGGNRQQ
jgi:hypothetical protein